MKILSLGDEEYESKRPLFNEFWSERYAGDESISTRYRVILVRLCKLIMERELTESQKICMQRKIIYKEKVEDIAKDLGVEPCTVYKHIRLGKKRVRQLSSLLLEAIGRSYELNEFYKMSVNILLEGGLQNGKNT